MRKRFLSLLLGVTMTAAMLAGCGGSSSETGTEANVNTEAGSDTEQGADQTESADGGTLIMPVTATVTSLNRLVEGMAEGWLVMRMSCSLLISMRQDFIWLRAVTFLRTAWFTR